ncbi:hypothetical protein CVT26_013360 [Gymnopilus dilepis]|uniref:Uncharacterized protein n=1 Tax=Gymnopilus dilepis TaxID=231916 RepID=A0A409WDB9_9AGAR|nr:hypothetical protein CVT26_013360 [Gymnopilus dilepis]
MFRSRTKVTPLDLSKLKKRKDHPSPSLNQSDEQDASISPSSSPASSASSQGSDYTLFTTPSPSESEETRCSPPARAPKAFLRNSRVFRLSMSKTRGEFSPIVISDPGPSPPRIYNKNKILPPTPEDIALSESGFQYPLTFWDLEQWDSSLNVDVTDHDSDPDPDSPSSMQFTIGVNLDPDDDEGGQQFYIIHHKSDQRFSRQTAPVDANPDPDDSKYDYHSEEDDEEDDDDDADRQFLFEVLKRSGQLWLDTNRASLLLFRLPLPDADTGQMHSGQWLDQDRAPLSPSQIPLPEGDGETSSAPTSPSPSPSSIPNPSPSPRLPRSDPKRQNRSGGLFVWSPTEGSYVQVKTPDCSDANSKCKHDADCEMSE